MRQIRLFRAISGSWSAGIWGSALLLLAGEAPAQIRPANPASPPAASPATDPVGKTVKLRFFNEDWVTVLNEVAKQSGSTLVMHGAPTGRITRHDRTPYTRSEAVQILNHELEPEGFRILEKDQFLMVLHQRTMRTRYRRPERPTQPEWQPKPLSAASTEEPQKYHRSVTAIATRETAAPPADSSPTRSAVQTAGVVLPESAASNVHQAAVPAHPPATNPSANPATGGAEPWTQLVLMPRNKVRDLASKVYTTLRSRAVLVDAGLQGLPAFRIVSAAEATEAGTPEFEVAIDIEQNRLVMASTPKRLRALADLFQALDLAAGLEQNPIQLVAANASTAHVAEQLTPQLNQLAQRKQPPQGKPDPFAEDKLFAQLQPEPNPQPPAQAQPPDRTQVLPLQPAGEVESLIANFRGDVQIQSIPDLGIMILRGNEADVQALVKIIQEIERRTAGSTPDIRLLLLKNVNSETLAELLRSVYGQLATIRTRTGQVRQQVSFIPIARPNALMILAPQADMESIQKLADELDRPIDPASEMEVFRLKSANASQVAAQLIDLFRTQAAAATGTGADAVVLGLQPRLRVVADVRTNSVIVQARPNDLKEIRLVVDKLDNDQSASVSKMRIFPLKNAIADELANVISSAINSMLNPQTVTGTPPAGQITGQQGIGAGQGPAELRDAKSVVLEFLSTVGEQEQSVRSGILSDIRVTPDLRSNSLVVSAPEKSLELMAALIEQLDQPTSTVAEIKVFTLENADANAMIELLETLFEQQDAAQPGVQIVGAEDASSGLIPLRFSVDVRTNSIIAIGGGDALRVVEAILLRLDESEIRQRQTTVIKLRNSPATEVALAINTFLQSQRELAAIDPELVSNIELLEREIIAVAEPVSNSLLISATPRYFEEIKGLVAKLDEEPPQVVIQALLVEVTLDNADEFGVELGFQDDILFDRSVTAAEDLLTIEQTNTAPNGVQTTTQQIISQATTPGFQFNNQPLGRNISADPSIVGSQGLSNFSLGRVNSDLGFGGLVLSASSSQVSMLIRALAARRQVHVLSRPQIRTLDNQLAQIQVGQQVPVVDGVTFTGTNNTVLPLIRQDNAGIILTVTPRISPEENIVMEVVAEKSAFTGAGATIFIDPTTGNTLTSPIKDITTARTTVGVRNGQTIVLGGMITKNDETIERKVPYFGDIPILGLLGRYDSTRTRRTELLIFLTPRIVRGDADSELIKQVESERIHFIEEEAEMIHGPLFSLPGQPGDSLWMPGDEFCPIPGEDFPLGQGGMLPGTESTIPAPAPQDQAPQVPARPVLPPAERMPTSGIPDNQGVPTTVMPASAVQSPPGQRPPGGNVRGQSLAPAQTPRNQFWKTQTSR